ncbi:glycosyl hydrolase family 85-domain-containing protein [Lipomyces oligophaga]|uniref:glycosyl hydrolase family 85-domain-containing protein n=1 Tax=Lipomyces oligophaga TaxID=45792 RepID=UPI0034CE4D5A
MSLATACPRFPDLSSLDNWANEALNSEAYNQDLLFRCRTPIRARYAAKKIPEPTLLLCHDFKGGYVADEDLDCQGYFPHHSGIAYWVRAFQVVNTFVYFSHTRVTIPPVSWTTGTHKSGVLCLGTLIFEGSDAASDASRLLTPNISGVGYHYADLLSEVARYFGFDGYLINMETVMANIHEAKELVSFIEYFRFALHRIVGSHSKIIWYDSLTLLNEINYQDCLNEQTMPFFRAADGLFTNYFWDASQVFSSARLAGQALGPDIWTGIDVWGRNVSYPAKSQVGRALKLIEDAGTSVALFGPAWNYEELGPKDFRKNDIELWYTARDKFTNDSLAIYGFFNPLPAPLFQTQNYQLFYTSFNTGHGNSFYVNGNLEFSKTWVNHALQTALPTYVPGSRHPELERYSSELYSRGITTESLTKFSVTCGIDYSVAFYGGSSLELISNPDEGTLNSRPQSQKSTSSHLRSASEHQANAEILSISSSTRVHATPLFKFDFSLNPEKPFILNVTFNKHSQGDVKIRLDGSWIMNPAAAEALSIAEIFAAESGWRHSYEANFTNSVLNSWVRKSFSFSAPAIPKAISNVLMTSNCSKYEGLKFVIDHLDVLCSENFKGSIHFGSILLFSEFPDLPLELNSPVIKTTFDNNGIGKDGHEEILPSVRTIEVPTPSRVAKAWSDSYRLIRWPEDEETMEWVVYMNSQMVGVASAPGWIFDNSLLKLNSDTVTFTSTADTGSQNIIDENERKDSIGVAENAEVSSIRIRIDAVAWTGTVVAGVELVVSMAK